MGGPGSGRKKAPPGRPTKFTVELGNDIVRWVQAGNYVETAAGSCGVTPGTVRRWMRDGARAKKGALHDFSRAIKKAEYLAHSQGLARLRSHGGKSWQADAWFLERRWPHLWGRKDRGVADDKKDNAPNVHVYVPDNGRVPEKGGGKK